MHKSCTLVKEGILHVASAVGVAKCAAKSPEPAALCAVLLFVAVEVFKRKRN
jgi:hypothetical protein